MRSLSPLMFLSRNKSRALVLVLMMAFTMVPLIAGMYSDCMFSDFAINYTAQPYIMITPSGNGSEIYQEYNNFTSHVDDYKVEGATTVIYGMNCSADYDCILGFECGDNYFFCKNVEDFHKMRAIIPTIPDDLELQDGEVAISKYFANSWNVKEGDVIKSDFEKTFFYQDVTVKKVLDCDGYQCFGIISDYSSDAVMILRDEPVKPLKIGLFGIKGENDSVSEALEDMAHKIKSEYPKMYVSSEEFDKAVMKDQIGMLRYVLVLVTILVTVVLIITVNAVFTAVYDRRKFEFSLYKGIGIKSGEIFRKIFSEVLVMDVIGIAIGVLVTSVVVYILNEVLLASGQRLWFVPPIAVVMALICNAAVFLPVVLMNWRRVKKYDVTEF